QAHRRGAIAVASVVVAFHGVAFAFSLAVRPVYLDRYTLPALPALLLFAAAALAWRWWPLLLPPVVPAPFFPLWESAHPVDRDPWKQAAALVRAEAQPGDLLLVAYGWTREAMRYYLRGTGVRVLPDDWDWKPNRDIADVEAARRVWLLESI